MKRYIYIIVAVSLTACSKNLDKPPQDQISNSQYWKTAQDLETYTLQFYRVLPHFRTLGSIAPDFFIGNIGSDAVFGSDHQVRSTPAAQVNGSRTATISGGNWNWTN